MQFQYSIGCRWTIFFIYYSQIEASNYDIYLERREGIQGEKLTQVDYTNLKFTRSNGIHYVNGYWAYLVDMDDNYYLNMKLEYTPQRNQKFIKHPFKITRTNICEYYNTTYKKYTMKGFLGHTNFPVVPPEGLCPIPKGKYWLKDLKYQTEMLPANLPDGLWKIDKMFFNPQNEVIGGSRIYLWLKNKG